MSCNKCKFPGEGPGCWCSTINVTASIEGTTLVLDASNWTFEPSKDQKIEKLVAVLKYYANPFSYEINREAGDECFTMTELDDWSKVKDGVAAGKRARQVLTDLGIDFDGEDE